MNRIQLACYGLTASAFVLAGLLLSALPAHMEPSAEAALVVSRDNITAMTARTRDKEEALFVIENNSQRLLIFTLDIGKRRLERAHAQDLTQIFRSSAPAGGGNRNSR